MEVYENNVASTENEQMPKLSRCFQDDHELFDCLKNPDEMLLPFLVDHVINNRITECVSMAFNASGKMNRLDLIDKLNPEFGSDDLDWSLKGAAENGHSQLTIELIQRGCAINEQVLLFAINSGNLELVTYLIKLMDDVNFETLIRAAAINGDMKLIHGLIDLHVELKQESIKLDKALGGAAQGGHLDLILDLLSRGASDYDLAIWSATKENHSNIVFKLIELMNKEDRPINFEEIIIAAISGNHHVLAFELITFYLSDSKKYDNVNYNTLFRWAIMHEQYSLALVFVGLGVDDLYHMLGYLRERGHQIAVNKFRMFVKK